MKWELLFPCLSLALNVACAITWALAGNGPKVLYWIGATIINVALLY